VRKFDSYSQVTYLPSAVFSLNQILNSLHSEKQPFRTFVFYWPFNLVPKSGLSLTYQHIKI